MDKTRNIDICKILKGQEGIELFTDHFNWGKCKFLYIDKKLNTVVVKVPDQGGPFYFEFDKYGKRIEYDGSISYLYPSENEKDWSRFEIPIPEGTPMMCLKTLEKPCSWILQNYSRKKDSKHYVKHYNIYTKMWQESPFRYIVPFDKFDPMDIEKSLKNNIQVW